MAREDDLQYTADHEWVEFDGDIATVGITAFAAGQLGDIVYLDLPSVGDAVTTGDQAGELESTKSVGELIAPVSGAVVEINEAAAAAPEIVNEDPLGAGWLVRIKVDAPPEGLLARAEYDALTAGA